MKISNLKDTKWDKERLDGRSLNYYPTRTEKIIWKNFKSIALGWIAVVLIRTWTLSKLDSPARMKGTRERYKLFEMKREWKNRGNGRVFGQANGSSPVPHLRRQHTYELILLFARAFVPERQPKSRIQQPTIGPGKSQFGLIIALVGLNERTSTSVKNKKKNETLEDGRINGFAWCWILKQTTTEKWVAFFE